MTIWERMIVNLEKAAKKITAGAALFSERVRAEIAIARLRIKLDEIRSRINDQYRIIGKKVVEFDKKDKLPRTTEQLLKDEEIVTAIAEINSREKELEEIHNEIANEQAVSRQSEKLKEEA